MSSNPATMHHPLVRTPRARCRVPSRRVPGEGRGTSCAAGRRLGGCCRCFCCTLLMVVAAHCCSLLLLLTAVTGGCQHCAQASDRRVTAAGQCEVQGTRQASRNQAEVRNPQQQNMTANSQSRRETAENEPKSECHSSES